MTYLSGLYPYRCASKFMLSCPRTLVHHIVTIHDLSIQCYHCSEHRTTFYAKFFRRHFECEHQMVLSNFRNAPLCYIYMERGWKPLTSIWGATYPLYYWMFYTNIKEYASSTQFSVSIHDTAFIVTSRITFQALGLWSYQDITSTMVLALLITKCEVVAQSPYLEDHPLLIYTHWPIWSCLSAFEYFLSEVLSVPHILVGLSLLFRCSIYPWCPDYYSKSAIW